MIFLALVLVASAPVERSYPATVLSVHDGDTVRVDIDLGLGIILHDQPVRLRGIDAPELPSKSGLVARNHLQAFLFSHTVRLFVQVGSERDKYGRLLGRLLVEPCPLVCDASQEMLTSGNAAAYDGARR